MYSRDPQCVFCKVIAKELPSRTEYEDDEMIVIHSISPVAPIHLLVIPKEHIPSIVDLNIEHQALAGKMLLVAKDVAAHVGTAQLGYKLAFNVGPGGGQVIPHIHLHLLGKKQASDELNSVIK